MTIFFTILILFVSITLHEYSHGWLAYKLGDSTAKTSGRLTINPIAHIDLFGTIILPFLLLLISNGGFSFGYAKPIPINPYHFRNPRKDIMWVGLAGPAANFLIALFLILILKIFPFAFLSEILIGGIVINIILTVFNLVPIPPLDGSRVLAAMLPYRLSSAYLKLETIGSFIIIFLIMIGFFRWFIPHVELLVFSLFKIR